MSVSISDGTRKTAILLLSLDQGLAADVLGRLPREKIEQVTLAIAHAGNVTREEQESVLNEFKAAFISRPLMQPAGPQTARELLERTIDQTEVDPLPQRFDERIQPGPFAFLHTRHADEIRLLIDDEHPQTIAAITAQLPPSLAAQVLSGFDAVTQADLLGRLARLGPTDFEVLTEIAGLLQTRIGRAPVRAGGISRATEVLQESTASSSREVLRSLERKDSGLAESIRESLFSFGDLLTLSDESLAILLQETRDYPWSIAMKGCSSALRQRICSQLPKHLAAALVDEMNATGPVALNEISSVQRKISDAILILEADGRIELPKRELKRQVR